MRRSSPPLGGGIKHFYLLHLSSLVRQVHPPSDGDADGVKDLCYCWVEDVKSMDSSSPYSCQQ
jgi:hypothetical protein